MARNKRVDLVLVNPGNRTEIYQSLGSELAAIQPPVWVGLLTTFIRNRGYSVEVLDADAESLTPDQAADRVIEIDPHVMAIIVYGHQPSASTQVMPGASAICTAVKERDPQTKVLLVGGHVAALPEQTLREESADFVCGGEGPYTLLDLIEMFNEDVPDDLSKVRDLWYWEGDEIHVNKPAPLVMDLETEMPEMAWDIMPIDKYRAHNWHCFGDLKRQPYAALYTTLGCPYHCSFCCIQVPFKSGEAALGMVQKVNSYRFWSPRSIITQIDTLVNRYGVRNIRIADEMFVLNRSHVEGICDLIIERGYDLNIWAYARVDTVKEGMAAKLKEAGVNWLCFGIEAANERVRGDAQKDFSQDTVYKTIESVQAEGINVLANFIFGLPEDDLDTMQETLDMALELNCEFANFYSAMAYPGSQLHDVALKEGWPLPEKWSGYSQHSVDTLPLPTKHLSASEVLRFRDHAFQVYFSSPKYLDMITQKFGSETTQHIREMSSHNLVRAHA